MKTQILVSQVFFNYTQKWRKQTLTVWLARGVCDIQIARHKQIKVVCTNYRPIYIPEAWSTEKSQSP